MLKILQEIFHPSDEAPSGPGSFPGIPNNFYWRKTLFLMFPRLIDSAAGYSSGQQRLNNVNSTHLVAKLVLPTTLHPIMLISDRKFWVILAVQTVAHNKCHPWSGLDPIAKLNQGCKMRKGRILIFRLPSSESVGGLASVVVGPVGGASGHSHSLGRHDVRLPNEDLELIDGPS